MWGYIWNSSYIELRIWNQVSYDPRSYERNLCNCVYRSLKNAGRQQGLNPGPRDTGATLWPTELWSHWRWEVFYLFWESPKTAQGLKWKSMEPGSSWQETLDRASTSLKKMTSQPTRDVTSTTVYPYRSEIPLTMLAKFDPNIVTENCKTPHETIYVVAGNGGSLLSWQTSLNP